MATLLAVDVGNTNVTMGVFRDETLVATWRIATDARRTRDEYALMIAGMLRSKEIDPAGIDAASLCSVVPPLTEPVAGAVRDSASIDPLVVGPGVRTGIRISYDPARDVGTDRVMDAVAAYTLWGGPAVIVDFGTATVFDAVTADGEYIGGALAPGLFRAADALYESASQLRRVELAAPAHVIGRSTVESTQSGLVYGFVALVEGMVERFRQELVPSGSPDAGSAVNVVATGGLASLIAEHTDVFTHVSADLTLIGLRLTHEMNA